MQSPTTTTSQNRKPWSQVGGAPHAWGLTQDPGTGKGVSAVRDSDSGRLLKRTVTTQVSCLSLFGHLGPSVATGPLARSSSQLGCARQAPDFKVFAHKTAKRLDEKAFAWIACSNDYFVGHIGLYKICYSN